MTNKGKLIIVDGPDACGKTTLLGKIHARSIDQVVRVHHGAYLDRANIFYAYLDSMVPHLEEGRTVLMDRAWFDEPIYGQVMRGGRSRLTTAQMAMLNTVANGYDAKVIFCLPLSNQAIDQATSVYRARRGTEYVDTDARYLDLVRLYAQTVFQAYLPQLGQALYYDLTEGTTDDLVIDWALREPRNRGPGIGTWSPGRSILVVGDIANPVGNPYQLPFIDAKGNGCSGWLHDQLLGLNVADTPLYWVNAAYGGKVICPTPVSFIEELQPRHVIALGHKAAAWIPEIYRSRGLVTNLPHPSYWKRFRYNETYPLRRLIDNLAVKEAS